VRSDDQPELVSASAQDAARGRRATHEQVPYPMLDHHEDMSGDPWRYRVAKDQREHGATEE
jgi:hypothetical protein